MPNKIRRIQIATTTLVIGDTEQVYPHHNNSWVYIDHPTSTIQPSWEYPFTDKNAGRSIRDFDVVIREVFASQNVQSARYALWITNLKTVTTLQHRFTFTRQKGGWSWHSLLWRQYDKIYMPIGTPVNSQHWTEPTLLDAVEVVTRLLFPLNIAPDLSPDLTEMLGEN